ncbi:voltage-dependent anion channel [Amylostereum chailletii]|nr:voltage-dependent anion channel [Amylostereum chailletii]
MSSPLKKDVRDSVRHFTPAWFAVNMGTGAISILFANFPYGNTTTPMKILASIFFFLNLALFIVFTTVSAWRYIRYPDVWSLMIRHPVQSLYLGCFPMGATTVMSVATTVFYKEYGFGGEAFLYALWGFWLLDVAISALCVWWLVHIMFTGQKHTLERMTAVWLLPVVTFIVASATGGVLAEPLHAISPRIALFTITLCIFMVSIGLSLALMILTIYLHRLVVYGLPEGATIMSAFVPLGPTGQAGFSIVLIGQALQAFLPIEGSSSSFLSNQDAGRIIYVVCICISFFLWSLATMWLIFGLLGIYSVASTTRFPFKVPFWGIIFPNGVYANLTITLYRTLDVGFFRVWGAIYSGFTLALWIVVFGRTVMLVKDGYIFEAPCLEGMSLGPNLRSTEKRRSDSGEASAAATMVGAGGTA